tara:strand:+ start:30 stop:233 length:204 start_codon:yes stop_codon:yes gene_type:complete
MSWNLFCACLLVLLVVFLWAVVDRRKNGVNVIITDNDGSQRIVNIKKGRDHETDELIRRVKESKGFG